MVTPTANTSTPSHGAQAPSNASELENARSADTPAIPTPATIPKARSPSWVPPQTSRLDPATICPSVSSRKAVVSATPGMKTTRDGDHRAQTGVGDVVLHRERDDRRNAGRGEKRHERLDRPAPAAESPEGADERAQHCRARDVASGRMEDQRDPDGEYGVPEHARHVTEPVVHPSDRIEPLDADGRRDLAALRLARELVDGGDLIEARRPGEPRRGLDRRRLPLAEREKDECREGAEPGVAQLVRPRDHPEPRFHGVDRLADRAQR